MRNFQLCQALVLATFLQVVGGVATKAEDCPAERALYELKSEDGRFEIGFLRAKTSASMASDLYLFLNTPQRTYWFTFSVSNGYSGMTLVPVTDPTRADAAPDGPRELIDFGGDDQEERDVIRALRFYAMDEDFTFWFEPPNAGEPAPTYVMVPEMGLALWYSAGLMTDDPDADRDPMPRGIFQPDVCRDTIPEPVWP